MNYLLLDHTRYTETIMKNNFTYSLGRTAALVAVLAPFVFQVFPAGWQDLTLGFVLHAAVTWLNEYAHTTTPIS